MHRIRRLLRPGMARSLDGGAARTGGFGAMAHGPAVETPMLLAALAKTAIATMCSGPIVGGATAAVQAVDLVTGWLKDGRQANYESTLADLERGLRSVSRSERVDEVQHHQAIAQARRILLDHGLDSRSIVQLDLDPERVSASVLHDSATELHELDEAAREMCRMAIRTTYSTMLSKPDALHQLERAFQRTVLERLTELKAQPEAVAAALRGAFDVAAVADQRLEWQPVVYPPGALLRPEFGIVPFHGRDVELADFRTWAAQDRGLAVRLCIGVGGMGKTRLMHEVCHRLAAEGWRTGFLNPEIAASTWPLALDAVLDRHSRILIVVDYAETRLTEVVELLHRSHVRGRDRASPGPLRIVLLARAVGDWWEELKAVRRGVGDVLAGPATAVHPVRPLASTREDRRRVFELAADAFRSVVPSSVSPTVPALGAEHFDRVLYLLLCALAAVQGETIEGKRDLLDWALSREHGFLNAGAVAMDCGDLRGRPILQCAAVATLAGHAADRGEAARLISCAPLLRGQSAAVVDRVAELLHRLYPGEAWLQGVLPDLLGQHLVERALDEDPSLYEAAFSRTR